MSVFATHYKRPPSTLEPGGGERLVETAGYVSAQKRIESIIAAGRRLIESRSEQYDLVGDQDDDDFFDPTRRKNFDLVDAQELAQSIKGKPNPVSKASQSPQEGLEEKSKDKVTPAE